jgi:hypothetical protein
MTNERINELARLNQEAGSKAEMVKALREGRLFDNPGLEEVISEMRGARRGSTLKFVVEALRAGGYEFEDGEITRAEYAGVTDTGDVVYTIEYPAEDDNGVGSVYVQFKDGAWRADF